MYELWKIFSENNLENSVVTRDFTRMPTQIAKVKAREMVAFGPTILVSISKQLYSSMHEIGQNIGDHISSEEYSRTIYSLLFALHTPDQVYRRLTDAFKRLFEAHIFENMYACQGILEFPATPA